MKLKPYRLYSGNCAVLVSDRGGQLVRRLRGVTNSCGALSEVWRREVPGRYAMDRRAQVF